MSVNKLMEAIVCSETGRVGVGLRPPLSAVMNETEMPEPPVPFDKLIEYDFRFTYGIRLMLPPARREDALKTIRREMQELLYGQMRHRLIELDRSIMSEDIERAHSQVRDIMAEVMG